MDCHQPGCSKPTRPVSLLLKPRWHHHHIELHRRGIRSGQTGLRSMCCHHRPAVPIALPTYHPCQRYSAGNPPEAAPATRPFSWFGPRSLHNARPGRSHYRATGYRPARRSGRPPRNPRPLNPVAPLPPDGYPHHPQMTRSWPTGPLRLCRLLRSGPL